MSPEIIARLRGELVGLPSGVASKLDAPRIVELLDTVEVFREAAAYERALRLDTEKRAARLEQAIWDSLLLSGYDEFAPHAAELILIQALEAK